MQSEIENLQQQKSTLEEDRKKLTLEKEYITSLLDEKEADFSEKLKDLKQLQEEIRRYFMFVQVLILNLEFMNLVTRFRKEGSSSLFKKKLL